MTASQQLALSGALHLVPLGTLPSSQAVVCKELWCQLFLLFWCLCLYLCPMHVLFAESKG